MGRWEAYHRAKPFPWLDHLCLSFFPCRAFCRSSNGRYIRFHLCIWKYQSLTFYFCSTHLRKYFRFSRWPSPVRTFPPAANFLPTRRHVIKDRHPAPARLPFRPATHPYSWILHSRWWSAAQDPYLYRLGGRQTGIRLTFLSTPITLDDLWVIRTTNTDSWFDHPRIAVLPITS